MKRIATLLLVITMLTSSLGIQSFAAVPSDTVIQPQWNNTMTINYIFEFEETKIGYAEIAVTGQFGVNKIVGAVHIYRKGVTSWVWVAGDTISVNSQNLLMSVQANGISGEYYKAEFTITVYKNGVGEVITETCYDWCPSP